MVITDVHANLPALEAVLYQIEVKGYNQLIHLGDAIAIGPYPRECLELMISLEKIQFMMGNHDDWYVHGLPQPRPNWMTDGEISHQHWTHNQLGAEFIEQIKTWPWEISLEIESFKLTFLHYALRRKGYSFKDLIPNPEPGDLDKLFNRPVDYVFYGHTHITSDQQGRARYINPGSLGCQKTATAPYVVVEIEGDQCHIQQRYVPYEDAALFKTFEERSVPERTLIYNAFFGDRFPLPK